MRFKTDFKYWNRESKAKYIFLKYKSILVGRILDVGADKCYLGEHLSDKVEYVGIGLGSDKLNLQVNLERENLPFEDNSFDVVLCIDVLEHLENIHDVFDELCRVSKSYVIISLPNCYWAFWNHLKRGDYRPGRHLKFHGPPLEKPPDRHKWFFSAEEAERFVRYKAKRNDMNIVQIDFGEDNMQTPSKFKMKSIAKLLIKKHLGLNLFNWNLHAGTMFAVIKK